MNTIIIYALLAVNYHNLPMTRSPVNVFETREECYAQAKVFNASAARALVAYYCVPTELTVPHPY